MEKWTDARCDNCGRWATCYRLPGMTAWQCKRCVGPRLRAGINGQAAPDLTPAMEIALRLWIDRVGVTAGYGYHFSHDVFSERTNQATAWRKSCGRLAAAGYLEADEAFIAAHWPSVVPPYRVTDKALAVLEMTREEAQPITATVDDGCPF